MARLAVVVDGVELGDADARAMWARFSAWMEAHKGDLAGFAASEGFSSVHPRRGADGAVLEASRVKRQEEYGTAKRVK